MILKCVCLAYNIIGRYIVQYVISKKGNRTLEIGLSIGYVAALKGYLRGYGLRIGVGIVGNSIVQI